MAWPFGTRHLSIDITNLGSEFSKSLQRHYLPEAKTKRDVDPLIFLGVPRLSGVSQFVVPTGWSPSETPAPAQAFQFHNTICEGTYPEQVV